jgi:shikimate kinase
MGTGKTEAGRALALRLDVPFIDTDARIEEKAQCTVSEIFARDGEPAFRKLERELVHSLSVGTGAVIATGGGTITDERNRAHLEALGTLVLLDADPGAIANRILGDPSRPMLESGADERDRIHSLYMERKPVSADA